MLRGIFAHAYAPHGAGTQHDQANESHLSTLRENGCVDELLEEHIDRKRK